MKTNRKYIISALITLFVPQVNAADMHYGIGVSSTTNEMTISDDFVAQTNTTFSNQSGSGDLVSIVLTAGSKIGPNFYYEGVLGIGTGETNTITLDSSVASDLINFEVDTEIGLMAGVDLFYLYPLQEKVKLYASLGYRFVKVDSFIYYREAGSGQSGYDEASDQDSGLAYGLGVQFTGGGFDWRVSYNDLPDVDLGYDSTYALSGFTVMGMTKF